MSHPNDLASFRKALLEGDRRLVKRRRTRAAAGALATVLAIVVVATSLPSSLDATALAAEAREALARPGLILHSETEVVLPDGQVQQRISRWSQGDRSRTISVAGGRTVEQAADGDVVRVRLEPGGRIDTLRGGAPDPLLEYRKVLDQATDAEEVTLDGVEAYRLEMPRQVAYLRRSDRLPLRVEIEGGVTLRYPVVEYVRQAQLDLR
jgi:hypothetical protein